VKSTVEQLSPTRVRINVEVPFDELKPSFDRAYRKLAQQVQVKGFRPGKVPARVLETRLGRSVVLDEVCNEAIPAKYREAVSAEDVRPLSHPEFEVTALEDRVSLAFTAEVDVRPEITLPDASGIAITVDSAEVTDDEVAEELDRLRTRFGTLIEVERPAAQDDFVVIDLSATVDGKPVEEAATTGLSYQVGLGDLVDGLDEALIGLSVGDSATFTSTLKAGQFADRPAEVRVDLTAVKERELPEADDEFAQLASEFDTLDELKADLRDGLAQAKRTRQAIQTRAMVLEALHERTEVPLPDSAVEAECELRLNQLMSVIDNDQRKLAKLLAEAGKTREEFDAETHADAVFSVKTQLLLDAVADAERVSVSELELTQGVVDQAQRYGLATDEFVKQLQRSGQVAALYSEIRRGKALLAVIRQASITDETGQRVDIGRLFGLAEDGTEAAATETTEAAATETTEAAATESVEDHADGEPAAIQG